MMGAQIEVTGGQVKMEALPHHFEPLQLDPVLKAQLAAAVRRIPGLENFDAAIAQALVPAAGSVPVAGSSVVTSTPPIKAFQGMPPIDWSRPVLLPQSFYRAALIPVPAATQPTPGASAAKSELVRVGPRTFLKPLPISDKALENVGHAVAFGQIGFDTWSGLDKASAVLPAAGTVADVLSASVAIAEIYQQVARPKKMPRWKKIVFYFKRVFYIVKGASHLLPVPGGESLMIAGVIVKACDKGCDEYYAIKVKGGDGGE